MQASVQSYPSGASDPPLPPPLDVLILYEDFDTGLRAKRSLDLLPAQFPANASLSTKLWRLQLLSDPFLSEQAATEAAAADVIILSVHGRNPLPAEARTWLTCWLGRKERRSCALGVLLDSGEVSLGSDNPVIGCVQQVAASFGVDLFYGFAESPVTELDSAMQEISQRAHQSSSVLDEMLKRADPHQWWGINE